MVQYHDEEVAERLPLCGASRVHELLEQASVIRRDRTEMLGMHWRPSSRSDHDGIRISVPLAG